MGRLISRRKLAFNVTRRHTGEKVARKGMRHREKGPDLGIGKKGTQRDKGHQEKQREQNRPRVKGDIKTEN